MKKHLLPLLAVATAALTGCVKHPDPSDPLEGYNRAMFAINQDIDHLAIKPITKVYSTITPPPLQRGITNAFENILELTRMPNDLLQGHFKYIAIDFWRLFINSTMGIGGLFDVATPLGLPKHKASFGLTLAKWRGGKSAPYFVIPIIGPSTIQAAIGLGVDVLTTPFPYISNGYVGWGTAALGVINYRAQVLAADKMIETSFDPYIFVRDAYLQNEKKRIDDNEALK